MIIITKNNCYNKKKEEKENKNGMIFKRKAIGDVKYGL